MKEVGAAIRHSREVMFGPPLDVLLQEARTDSADLLVLGITGDSLLPYGAGTLATKCLRKAPCKVMLVKASHARPFRRIVAGVDFSDTSREKMAGRGVAMPDGSYPIPDKDALRRAIASYGRASDPAAVKRHIIKRAKALGATDMLPEDWGGAPAKGSLAAQHSAQASDILEDLYCLIDCESDEPAHVAMLTQAAGIVQRFARVAAIPDHVKAAVPFGRQTHLKCDFRL